MMPAHMSLSAIRDGRWHEYLVRFALGGAATVLTGWVAGRFGPSIGGLFLALPAIFCASATLIEKHEMRRKGKAGKSGRRRGQQAAALDAAGAAIGSFGLLVFAACFYFTVRASIAGAFVLSSLLWLIGSVAGWWAWRNFRIAYRSSRSDYGSAHRHARDA